MAITVQASTIDNNVVQASYIGEYSGYPYSFTPGPDTSDSAIIAPNTFGTIQLVEMRVDVDTNQAIVAIDWEAMDADDGWKKDVNNYVTVFGDEGQSTEVTLGYHITETGEEGQFVRTLTINDDGQVIVGNLKFEFSVPLKRSLKRALRI